MITGAISCNRDFVDRRNIRFTMGIPAEAHLGHASKAMIQQEIPPMLLLQFLGRQVVYGCSIYDAVLT